MLRVGLLGYGAVGQDVAVMVKDGRAGETEIVGALVRDRSKHLSPQVPLFDRVEDLLASGAELVIEVAGQGAVREVAARVLQGKKDLMIISVGALADSTLRLELQELARANGRRLIIPSGSIGALDAIAAASMAEITSVSHTIRKPPRAFSSGQLKGPPDSEQVVFEGPVSEGAGLFPENANAATAVGLAGIGPERTSLRIVSDPNLARNVQEVEVKGAFGELRFSIQNVPSSNPKTSRLVALSVVRTLRDLSASFLVI